MALAFLLLKPPPTTFSSMSVSGNLIATAGFQSGRLWDARNGKLVGILASPGFGDEDNNLLEYVCFSPDGTRILAGGSAPDGGWTPVWSRSGRLLFRMTSTDHEPPVHPIFSRDGRLLLGNLSSFVRSGLFAGNGGRTLREWKYTQWDHPRPLCAGPTAESFLGIQEDKLYILTRPRSGNWRYVGKLRGNYTPSDKYAMFDDRHHRLVGIWRNKEGEHVVTAHITADGRVGRQTVSRWAFPVADFHASYYCSRYNELLLGEVSGHVFVVNVATGKLLRSLTVAGAPVVDFGLTAGEKRLVIENTYTYNSAGKVTEAGKLTIWSMPGLKLIRTIKQ